MRLLRIAQRLPQLQVFRRDRHGAGRPECAPNPAEPRAWPSDAALAGAIPQGWQGPHLPAKEAKP